MTAEEQNPKVAYFSMEIALDPSIPTYSGGLGMLAGDMLRSAADLQLPMVAVTLVHRKGYFRQKLDGAGNQTAEPDPWDPARKLQLTDASASVVVEDRQVHIRAWRYDVVGISGCNVPVYLLDSDVPENHDQDRTLTDSLYGGDTQYRICQETLLGIGGIGILRSLGLKDLAVYHMNEGHSSFLTLALLEEQLRARNATEITDEDMQAVRRQCVFTTHTPVPAGHDQFTWDLVKSVLGVRRAELLNRSECCQSGLLNMTYLALRFSRYVNGVAMRHEEVSQSMFPNYPIHAITNGVHATTWASTSFAGLFDRHIPEWRRDTDYLRYAVGIPLREILTAHAQAKSALLAEVKQRTGAALDPAILTIGFARRAAAYKRADLLFSDVERLAAIAKGAGTFQVIYGGKAHPHDEAGQAAIRRVFEHASQLKDRVQVVYVENYDWNWAARIIAGVDVWLNTPQRPQEASGTSGMKAAMNGIPSLSILDGWWIEGCFEGTTGWAIGHDGEIRTEDAGAEVESLYLKLEQQVIPMFYQRPNEFAEMMRSAIAINGSFFNTQRMVEQYEANAYFPEKLTRTAGE